MATPYLEDLILAGTIEERLKKGIYDIIGHEP